MITFYKELFSPGRLILVGGGVGEVSELEGFFALHTSSAFSAVEFLAFVAGPGVGEIDIQFCSARGNVFLAHIDEGTEKF